MTTSKAQTRLLTNLSSHTTCLLNGQRGNDMENDIRELIEKYRALIERIETNIEMFPEEKKVLFARRNVYKDMILDLENILEKHKEEIA